MIGNGLRVDGEEVARRAQAIDTAVSFPYRKKPASSAKATDLLISKVRQLARPNLIVVHSAPDKRVLRWARPQSALSRTLGQVRDFAGAVWLLALARVQEFRVFLRERYAAVNVSEWRATAGGRLSHAWARLREISKYKVEVPIQPGAPSPLRGVRRSASAWATSVRPYLRQRKWVRSPLLIAGVAVVLGVATILAFRRNVPAAGALNGEHVGSPRVESTATPADREVAVPLVQPRNSGASPVSSAGPSTSEQNQPLNADNHSAAPRHKGVRHRNPDEDYVAKDTYKYYGLAGKPASRR